MPEQANTGQAAASENTPLLPSSNGQGDEQAADVTNASPGNADMETAAQPSSRPVDRPMDILVMTWVSLVLSAVGIAAFMTAFISLASWTVGQKPTFHYWAEYSAGWNLFICFLAAVVASFNLRLLYRENRPMWLGPNLFVDMALAFYLCINTLGPGMGEWGGWAYCSKGPDYYPPRPPTDVDRERYAACKPKALVLNVLFGIAFGSALVLAFVHLCLATKRWIEVFRARRREGNGVTRFSIPSGHVSFEFTVKFLRQENPRVETAASGAQV